MAGLLFLFAFAIVCTVFSFWLSDAVKRWRRQVRSDDDYRGDGVESAKQQLLGELEAAITAPSNAYDAQDWNDFIVHGTDVPSSDASTLASGTLTNDEGFLGCSYQPDPVPKVMHHAQPNTTAVSASVPQHALPTQETWPSHPFNRAERGSPVPGPSADEIHDFYAFLDNKDVPDPNKYWTVNNSAPVEEGPLFVNAKQFERILKRRMARQKLEEMLRLAAKGKERRSREMWNGAMRYPRDANGRFLTRDRVEREGGSRREGWQVWCR